MSKLDFIRKALEDDPQVKYAEVNRRWLKEAEANGWEDDPATGILSFNRLASNARAKS